MDKIPTAEEYIKSKQYPSYNTSGGLGVFYVEELMKQFAKLHVEAALSKANEQVKTRKFASGNEEYFIDRKHAILDSYPLSLIK